MRLALIDILICPRCQHFPLNTEIEHEIVDTAPVLKGYRCTTFCADRMAPRHPDDSCEQCLRRNVITGRLTCSGCQAAYPIAEGIPNFILSEHVDDWIGGEQQWWDDYYRRLLTTTNVMQRRKGLAPERLPGIRPYERYRWLFTTFQQAGSHDQAAPLPILEIGAGMGETVANLYPPANHNYLYIATDVSKSALQIAARLIPEGEFVQCTVDHLPFRPQSFQAIFCFGVLHHIPKWQESLATVLRLLLPGGQLLFDEVIKKPRIFGRWRKRSLTADQDSPHEGSIELGEFERLAQRHGILTIKQFKASPVRFGINLIAARAINSFVFATKVVVKLDYGVCRFLGPIFKSFGPAEIIGSVKVP